MSVAPHVPANRREFTRAPLYPLRLPGGGPGSDLSAASATPFSRYLPQEWQPGTAILKRPIKVLVAVASPANLPAYNLQPVEAAVEFASLRQATSGITDEEAKPVLQFDLLPPPCTLDAIRDRLKDGYHVRIQAKLGQMPSSTRHQPIR
jgi:hypothetical protein